MIKNIITYGKFTNNNFIFQDAVVYDLNPLYDQAYTRVLARSPNHGNVDIGRLRLAPNWDWILTDPQEFCSVVGQGS